MLFRFQTIKTLWRWTHRNTQLHVLSMRKQSWRRELTVKERKVTRSKMMKKRTEIMKS